MKGLKSKYLMFWTWLAAILVVLVWNGRHGLDDDILSGLHDFFGIADSLKLKFIITDTSKLIPLCGTGPQARVSGNSDAPDPNRSDYTDTVNRRAEIAAGNGINGSVTDNTGHSIIRNGSGIGSPSIVSPLAVNAPSSNQCDGSEATIGEASQRARNVTFGE